MEAWVTHVEIQPMFITNEICEFDSHQRQCATCTKYCDTICQLLLDGFPDTPVSSINKTDSHDITEILLKVALKYHSPLLCDDQW
jgi:hypothetical protein